MELLAGVLPAGTLMASGNWKLGKSAVSGPDYRHLADAASADTRGKEEVFEDLFNLVAAKNGEADFASIPKLALVLRVPSSNQLRGWFEEWIIDGWIVREYKNPQTRRGGFTVKFGQKAPRRASRRRA